jgi:hypothetical protein
MEHLACGNAKEFYIRAQIEGEIHQHNLSLREIDEKRLLLAAGLVKNDLLQRLVMRRRRKSCFAVNRTKSRNRAFGLTGGSRHRKATN